MLPKALRSVGNSTLESPVISVQYAGLVVRTHACKTSIRSSELSRLDQNLSALKVECDIVRLPSLALSRPGRKESAN
jgi:hypothetical protein